MEEHGHSLLTQKFGIFDEQLWRAHGVNAAKRVVSQLAVKAVQRFHEVYPAQNDRHGIAEQRDRFFWTVHSQAGPMAVRARAVLVRDGDDDGNDCYEPNHFLIEKSVNEFEHGHDRNDCYLLLFGSFFVLLNTEVQQRSYSIIIIITVISLTNRNRFDHSLKFSVIFFNDFLNYLMPF